MFIVFILMIGMPHRVVSGSENNILHKKTTTDTKMFVYNLQYKLLMYIDNLNNNL